MKKVDSGEIDVMATIREMDEAEGNAVQTEGKITSGEVQ